MDSAGMSRRGFTAGQTLAIRTRDLSVANRTRYHCATSPLYFVNGKGRFPLTLLPCRTRLDWQRELPTFRRQANSAGYRLGKGLRGFKNFERN